MSEYEPSGAGDEDPVPSDDSSRVPNLGLKGGPRGDVLPCHCSCMSSDVCWENCGDVWTRNSEATSSWGNVKSPGGAF